MEIYQRVSQGLDGAEPAVNRILEGASHVVGRCKEAAGDVEQAEGCKGRQVSRRGKRLQPNVKRSGTLG